MSTKGDRWDLNDRASSSRRASCSHLPPPSPLYAGHARIRRGDQPLAQEPEDAGHATSTLRGQRVTEDSHGKVDCGKAGIMFQETKP